MVTTIYMPLLNEGTDVWRPVAALKVQDCHYLVTGKALADEEWAYTTGMTVVVDADMRIIAALRSDDSSRLLPVITNSATQTEVAKTRDPNRFHRIVGWIFAVGFLVLIGLPVLLISMMGECLPSGDIRMSDCLGGKRIEFFVLLFGLPILAGTVGWLTCRCSKFLG